MQIRRVELGRQVLRVGIRRGDPRRPPLLIFNGIGANLELVAPFVAALRDTEVVVFDVPGAGGSPAPPLPYRFSTMAELAASLLTRLGYARPVDVLGVSWGGALAQQFALSRHELCRRLVLASTSPGVVMLPGRLSVLARLVGPRRYMDSNYLERVGPMLYGGAYRRHPSLLREHGRHMRSPRGRGYLYQLLAAWGWSSLPWLHRLRQATLVVHGRDDPIVPLANAKFLAARIPRAELRVIDDGHLLLVARAPEVADLVEAFLATTGR
jgi:poly(3-hydroxyalkanoate) depolymerase